MLQMTESQFVDRFVSRVCSLHPEAEPTDLLEYAVDNYLSADMAPEEAAALFAAEIADHWLSIGRRPIPSKARSRRGIK